MTIFEALRADHDTQRTLIDLLCKTEGDSEGRQELFDKVRLELSAHAKAEERHFYVPLMEVDMTQEKARHSVAEHHELDEMIEELTATDRSSPHWLAVAKQLQHKLHHHLEEEEQEVFPVAGRVLNDSQKDQLASDYRKLMDEEKA